MRYFKYKYDDEGISLVRELKHEPTSAPNGHFCLIVRDSTPIRCVGASVSRFSLNENPLFRINVRGKISYATCSGKGLKPVDFNEKILLKWCEERSIFESVTDSMRNSFVDNGLDGLLSSMAGHVYIEFNERYGCNSYEHDCVQKVKNLIKRFYMDHAEVLSVFVAGGVRGLVLRIFHEVLFIQGV
jgi:hypothetical protein